MICKNCGQYIDDDSKLCPYCGKVLTDYVSCPTCGSIMPKDSNKCSICGHEFTKNDNVNKPNDNQYSFDPEERTSSQTSKKVFCTRCGHPNSSESKFCINCGAPISRTSSTNSNPQSYTSFNPQPSNVNHFNTPAMVEIPASRKQSILAIVLYFSIFYLVSPIIAGIIGAIVKSTSVIIDDITYANMVASVNLIVYALLFATVFVVMFSSFKKDLFQSKQNGKSFWGSFGMSFGILFVASFAASFIMSIIIALTPLRDSPINDSGNQETLNLMLVSNPFSTIVTIVMSVLAAPIIEELVFRKAFFGLSRKKGKGIILISAALFGAIHVVESVLSGIINSQPTLYVIHEAIYFISYFASGLALGFAYYKTKNIIPVIVAHATWNLLSVILSFVTIG